VELPAEITRVVPAGPLAQIVLYALAPEMMAGLGCPRTPIEIVNSEVKDRNGNSVDAALRASVDMILTQVRREGIRYAILKSRSPTCGVRPVYDGTFSGTLINGAGVLAQALMDAGCQVIDSEELPDIL
jgi:uncharacterized protein YbbK (DUF523 family)